MAFTVVPIHNLDLPPRTRVDFGGGFVFQDLPEWVKQDPMLDRLSGTDQYGAREASHAWVAEYTASAIGEPDPDWKGKEPRSIQETKTEKAFFANLALWTTRPSIACFTSVFHAICPKVAGKDDPQPFIQQSRRYDALLVHPDDFHGRITLEDIEAAGRLHQKLVSIPRDNPLWTAVRAFWQGLTINTADLRCALFWIGLEALFGPEGNTGELRYRLSHRIAFFLSDEPAKTRDIPQRVKACYDTRSKIVHGRWNNDPEIDDIIRDTENVIRQALNKILDEPRLLNIFVSKGRDEFLDNLVFLRGLSSRD